VTENKDQEALVQWISAGLSIPGVHALHGDAGYLLNNMIAKYSLAASEYRLSSQALALLVGDCVDLTVIHSRSKFYGKNSRFIYEHAVPVVLVRQRLLAGDADPESVRRTLRAAGPVAMIRRTEDDALRRAGLRATMPGGWRWGDNFLARYQEAGIVLADQVLRVRGKLKR
jgi:hypothetical protein